MGLFKKTLSTEGMILSCTAYGDRDKIARVLTTDYGKLTIISKNCRGSKSKNVNHLELFDAGALVLKPSSSSDILSIQGQSNLRGNIRLTQSFERMIAGSLLLETVDLLTAAANESDGELLPLLHTHLEILARKYEAREILKTCYDSLCEILDELGFPLQNQSTQASLHNLRKLVVHIEANCGRTVNTMSSIEMIAKRLRRKVV